MTATALLLLLVATLEPEQDSPRPSSFAAADSKGYVQAAPIMIVAPSGTANHRVTPPISGKTIGIGASGGVFVTPTIAIEAEFVFGKAISMPQQFSYFWNANYIAQSRDLLLNGNVRWKPDGTRHLELIGGGGLAISTFAERSIVRTDFFPARKISEPDQIATSRQPTLGGGIDIPFSVSATIEIVPTFRLRWVKRADGFAQHLGVGPYLYQFGTTVRIRL
jgi:hypothetical protein